MDEYDAQLIGGDDGCNKGGADMDQWPAERVVDLYGLDLSTTPEAAEHYNEALGRILRLESDAHAPLLAAVASDPSFAMGHATLAVLGHEFGTDSDTQAHFDRAVAVLDGTSERERLFIEAYSHRLSGDFDFLLSYLRAHPRDVLGISIAMPTVAFSGAYDVPEDAWLALEEMAPHFDDDWWFSGLMAFARQDQGRMDEARELAEHSLGLEPRGGNAAHAAAHVYFETGQHDEGLAWIDHWISDAGQDSTHRCHFSWHAALYELALDKTDAVVARYQRELAPPTVVGIRALVDASSLLWRFMVEQVDHDGCDPQAVIAAAGPTAFSPTTPFAVMHAAVVQATVGDERALAALATRCAASADPVMAGTMVTLIEGLQCYLAGDMSAAADAMVSIRSALTPIGGSYAQREVVLDTAISALIAARRGTEAAALLEQRLERRARPRDLILLDRASAAR